MRFETIGDLSSLNPKRTACFTGHRPEKLPQELSTPEYLGLLKTKLRESIIFAMQRGCDAFLCGMQRGVDIWAAKEVIWLREICPRIRLICISPFAEEISSRKGTDRFDYEEVMAAADGYIALRQGYSKACFSIRNRFMVDRSSVLIAAVCDYKSGTGQTIAYARKKGLDISLIDLNNLGNLP